MEQNYNIGWSETALNELAKFFYPPQIKEKIYLDSLRKLSFMPTLSAKRIPFGEWQNYWARLGLYKVTLIFELDEKHKVVYIDAIKHKRQNKYWIK
ncbi:MAG: hypothetical protein VR72_18725 [Clostridiaceae bacterium BRH_c20a]|nr:MAG: hypothetical protein VR72_18725 [Clostridiaceae bacterium BRH_c20a]